MGMPDYVSFTNTWHHKPYPLISPTRPELSVKGKHVVVTGGGTGIGKAIAIAYAQANAASVFIIGRRLNRLEEAVAEIKAEGPSTRVLAIQGDLSDQNSVDAAFARIANEVGKIDIFVSNAGIANNVGSVIGYDGAEFRRGIDINLLGAFNAVQAFARHAAPDAKLFNISSGIGHISPTLAPGMWTYAVLKAAIIKMFDYIAFENPNLHVVHIQPGVILTEINEPFNEGFRDSPKLDSLELPGAFLVWLASKEAAFLKDKFVWVNWDVEELISRAEEIQNDANLLRVNLSGVAM